MKSPKGFGKKYFTFASILAHSIHTAILAIAVKTDYLLQFSSKKEDDIQEETDPPSQLLEFLCVTNKKPCHCDCVFRLRSKLSLKINHFVPRCPFYTTYFAFRRTGVHPPFTIL